MSYIRASLDCTSHDSSSVKLPTSEMEEMVSKCSCLFHRIPSFELHGPGDLEVRLQKDLIGNHGRKGQICT